MTKREAATFALAEQMLEKWNNAFLDAGLDINKLPQRVGLLWDLNESFRPVAWMQCVTCEVWKPRTTVHYTVNGKRPGWLERYPPGFESLQNSPSHPCNECWAAQWFAMRRNDRDTFLKSLNKECPLLDIPKMMAELSEFGKVTGLPTGLFMLVPGHMFTPSPHDIARQHRTEGTGYNQACHHPTTTELDLAVFNTRQDNAISDLPAAHKRMYIEIVKMAQMSAAENEEVTIRLVQDGEAWWKKTPRNLGILSPSEQGRKSYNIQCKRLHLLCNGTELQEPR